MCSELHCSRITQSSMFSGSEWDKWQQINVFLNSLNNNNGLMCSVCWQIGRENIEFMINNSLTTRCLIITFHYYNLLSPNRFVDWHVPVSRLIAYKWLKMVSWIMRFLGQFKYICFCAERVIFASREVYININGWMIQIHGSNSTK